MGRMGQIVRIGVGVLLGLIATEAAFSWRADGAFPHINVLQADPVLGVRLTPDTTQRIKVADNPTSALTINDAGWRGADFTEAGGIVVVGDSQVFGLGVNDDETTPAQLAQITGKPTYNGGVPTYGPEEYLLVIEELCASQSPSAVVLVLNFANDLFELGRANTQRHRVWDGWAVRAETAPESVVAFPGRRWLFSQSHAVYALRRLLYTPDEQDAGQGFPSEGDVSDAMTAMLSDHLSDSAPSDSEIQALIGIISETSTERLTLDERMTELMRGSVPYTDEEQLALEAVESRARPGDIVHERYAEASRDIEVTAAMLRQGARLQRNMKQRFQEWLEENPDHDLAVKLRENSAIRKQMSTQIDEASERIAADLAAASPFQDVLTRARAITDRHNAELVVVALPLDVQVDPEEWRKYGEEPSDMSETLPLLDGLTAAAHRMGIRSLSAAQPLRDAQPGAFLNADIHLTPHGHRALAEAIARTLDAPAPLLHPGDGIPEGRSRVPLAADWVGLAENTVRGSTRNNCVTQRIREWQRVTCMVPHNAQWTPIAVTLEAGSAETMLLSALGLTNLITPLMPGQDLSAVFHWGSRNERLGRTERLNITWKDGEPVMAFSPVDVEPVQEPPTSPLAACLQSSAPSLRFGDDTRGCAETWTDCRDLISCAQGTRLRPPKCPEGEAIAGSAGHCFALCDASTPCKTGTCTQWMDGQVCL
ncbi:MAG: hypothetical protein ACI8RZ_003178 [Myxococcota bacterium]|jgi:hypothetical protein